MTKYYFLVISFLFCHTIVAQNKGAHTIHLPTSDSGLKKLGATKVLSGVSNNSPKIYADSAGNEIVFAITKIRKNKPLMPSAATLSNQSNKSSETLSNQANSHFASTLVYSVFDSSRKKWLAQKTLTLAASGNSRQVVHYQLINAHSSTHNVLLVTSKERTRTQASKNNAGVLTVDHSLWSVTKQGLTGQWNKPQRLLNTKGPLPVIQQDCNKVVCIMAWQKTDPVTQTGKLSNVRRLGTKIVLKSLLLDQQARTWEALDAVNVPHNQQLLQLKVLTLDANNWALIWVAAVKSVNKGQKKNRHKLRLKIFVRMRINHQWQKTLAVATLGDYGRVRGLGDLTVAADSSRRIIISWSEKRETAELRSVYFDQQWFPASTVYRDNPDVSSLSAQFSKQGKATLIWQQQYGKNTHIFYSELNAKTHRWTAPYKLDKNPNSAILKNITRTASNQIMAVWLKNFSRVQLAYIDKGIGPPHYLNITSQDTLAPDIALLENRTVSVCWLRSKRSSYEVWVQQLRFKQVEGK